MCGEQLCGKLSSNCVDSVEWRYVASGRPVSLCQLGSVSALTRYKGDLPLCRVVVVEVQHRDSTKKQKIQGTRQIEGGATYLPTQFNVLREGWRYQVR